VSWILNDNPGTAMTAPEGSNTRRNLDPARITATIEQLSRRSSIRFPESGLSNVCQHLLEIARRTAETAAWIDRPLMTLRIAIGLLLGLIAAGLAVTVRSIRAPTVPLSFAELIQLIESGVNDLVFVAVSVFFLVSIETRIKRRRALRAIHELRSIAHVIDMHQLTKDPELVLHRGPDTGVLPRRTMTRFELTRYLDYCSEALSLTGKVAALYIQNFEDEVALQAVNEVEDLTTGLSRKIWQKLTILYSIDEEDLAPLAAAPPPSH
jgi:hypothetical protein